MKAGKPSSSGLRLVVASDDGHDGKIVDGSPDPAAGGVADVIEHFSLYSIAIE